MHAPAWSWTPWALQGDAPGEARLVQAVHKAVDDLQKVLSAVKERLQREPRHKLADSARSAQWLRLLALPSHHQLLVMALKQATLTRSEASATCRAAQLPASLSCAADMLGCLQRKLSAAGQASILAALDRTGGLLEGDVFLPADCSKIALVRSVVCSSLRVGQQP